MRPLGRVAVFGVIAGLGIWITSLAAQHQDQHPGDVPPSPSAIKVKTLGMAYGLIEYGRENKIADALVTAALILQQNKAEALPESDKTTTETPLSILKEAKGMTEDKGLLARIASVEELLNGDLIKPARGSVGGNAFRAEKIIPAGKAIVIDRTFKGKHCAKIQLWALSQYGDFNKKTGKQNVIPPSNVRLTIYRVVDGKKTQVDLEFGTNLEYHAYPSEDTKYHIIVDNPGKISASVRVLTN